MLFNFISILNYEKRFTVKRPANLIQSFIFGLAFGAAWTPCVGTILGSILILASQQGNAQQSIMYLLTYSAGLGLPLIAAAVFLGYFLKIQKQVLSFLPYINKASAILIIALGIVIVFGKMNLLLAYLY
jgi:cytochrome c-type biogenesis protein